MSGLILPPPQDKSDHWHSTLSVIDRTAAFFGSNFYNILISVLNDSHTTIKSQNTAAYNQYPFPFSAHKSHNLFYPANIL